MLNIFLLDVNFDKFTIELYFLLVSFMVAKFFKNQGLLDMSKISSFCCIKLYTENNFMDQIYIYI